MITGMLLVMTCAKCGLCNTYIVQSTMTGRSESQSVSNDLCYGYTHFKSLTDIRTITGDEM
jgi:hypothetical protein